MAGGFGDGNDIKITVSLDTTDAVAGLEALKGSLEKTLEAGTRQFEDLAKASAKINAAEVARIKAASAEKVAQLKLEKAAIDERTQADAKAQAAIEAAAQKRADLAKRELTEIKNRAAERLNAQKIELNSQKIQLDSTTRYLAELQKEGKTFRETEATKRAEIQKTIALIKQQTQEIKRQSAGAGAGGSGGLLSSFGSGKQFSGLINSFGTLNSSALRAIGSFGKFGGALAVVVGISYGAVKAINKVTEESNKLADQAFKIEGLRTGFENLQRTIGNSPDVSIVKLREATQGLISDTELYQRANQAVLLGVPTETFNAAAAAAVKLGRAMGIDASQGLESLSLGLGRQSRLYLDNLGIIVSAEEAYKRFAAANNLVASQLSDGEKKAAFYAEALRKIYERAAELPDPIDSVAVSYKKFEVAQQNVTQAGLESFNGSVELASAYRKLTKATEDSTDVTKRFSIAASEIAAKFVSAKASLVSFGTSVKEVAVYLASFVVPTTPVEQFTAAVENLNRVQQRNQFQQLVDGADEYARAQDEATKKVADSIAIFAQREVASARAADGFSKSADRYREQLKGIGDDSSASAKFLKDLIKQTESLARASSSESLAAAQAVKEQRKVLEERKAAAEQAVRDAEKTRAGSLDKLINPSLRSNAEVLKFVVQTNAQEELDQANAALNFFDTTYNKTKASAEAPIKLRVDLSEVEAAASRLPSLFASLNQSALREAGVFKIPGVDDATLTGVTGKITELEKNFQLGKVKAEEYQAQLSSLSGEFQKIVGDGYLQQISTEITQLEDAQRSGAALTQEQSTRLDQLRTAYFGAAQGASASAAATEEVRVAFDFARKAGAKAASDIQRDQKKISSAVEKESKKAANEYKKFVRDIYRTFDKAIPKDFQKKLTDLFNTGVVGSDEFIRELEKLGDEAIKAGVDIEALKKEIEALAKIKLDNPLQEITVDSKTTNDIKELKDQISSAGVINLKDLFGGETSGGFFGFDIPGLEIGNQVELAGQIQDSIGQIAQAGVDGFSKEDAPQIGAAIGSVIGGAIGAALGGPVGFAVGAGVGSFVGTAIGIGLNSAENGSKQKIKDFFGEVFQFNSLGIVVQREVVDGVTEGVDGAQRQLEPVFARFNGLTYYNFTKSVEGSLGQFSEVAKRTSQETLNYFSDIANAFAVLLDAPDEAGNLYRNLVATLDGSLENLQVTLQQTGVALEDFQTKLVAAFRNGYLTIQETYAALVRIQNLYESGIPGAIGDYKQAIDNLFVSLQSKNPGQYALDSLRDIGAEGREAGASFESVITALGTTFGFTAQQMQLFFQALKLAGITTLEQLQKASDDQLIAILENYRRIKEEGIQTSSELAPVINTPAPNKTPSYSGPSKADEAKRKAEEEARKAADERKRQLEEAYKLTIESQRYAVILEKIAKGQLSQVDGGKEILKLRNEILRTTAKVAKLEAEYQAELAKGTDANRKRLAELGQQLDKATNRLDSFKEKAKDTKDATAQLDLAAVIPLIHSMNSLGVVTKQAGVEIDKNVSILVKGFLQGRLSIGELNDEIKKTKDLLGPGIPGAIGAVTDAFQNLINAGEQGGQFSVDAFADIFAEFRQKFEKEGSALRKAEREQLVANVNAAREAFDKAIGPEAVDKARKALDTAKKALEDFYSIQPKPDLADLRSELEKTFSVDQIDKFFQALDESGLSTFDDFEKAGADSVVGILGKLKELGFSFGTTSKEIKDINDKLQEQEKKANNGLDPLAQAIELVKQFNAGASTLPPVFNDTANALDNLNKPLAQLANGFDNIIEKLSRLSGNSFENEVVFNVRTVGDSTSKNLIEIIYGDGSSTGGDSGSNPGGDGSIREQIQRLRKELNRLVKSGKGSTPRADKLRDRIRKLRGELK